MTQKQFRHDNQPTAPIPHKERPWVAVSNYHPPKGARVEIRGERIVAVEADDHVAEAKPFCEVVLWVSHHASDKTIKEWRYAVSALLDEKKFGPPIIPLNPQPFAKEMRNRAMHARKARDCLSCGRQFLSEGAHNQMCDSCKGIAKYGSQGISDV